MKVRYHKVSSARKAYASPEASRGETYSGSKRAQSMERAAILGACDRFQEQQDWINAQGRTVQHVKDGKAMTEHGAKLLGVPWKSQEDLF